MVKKRAIYSPLNFKSSLILLLITFCITIGGFGGLFLILMLTDSPRAVAINALMLAIPLFSIAILITINKFLKTQKITWRELGFNKLSGRAFHLLWQLPLILLALIVVQVTFFSIIGSDPPAGGFNDLIGEISVYAAAMTAIGIIILIPIWEEIIFRGVIYSGLRKKWGVLIGLVLSSIIFTAAHFVPVFLPYFFTMAVAFVWLFEFHKTLWAPVIGHVLVNGIATLPVLFYLL